MNWIAADFREREGRKEQEQPQNVEVNLRSERIAAFEV
jgi:hypothetical protein